MNAREAFALAMQAPADACFLWPLGCEAAHGAAPEGKPNALHNCGNPSCVNPHHLRWGSQSENRDDMRGHGTLPVGRINGAAKLDDDQVRAIREVSARGTSQRQIARAFGIGVATVCNIVNRKAWSHVA